MNFNYTEEQLAIKDVADRIFTDLGSDERIKTEFAAAEPMHRDLWQQLAESGLLGAPLPERFGGSALGLTEFCLLVEAQGRVLAPIPLIQTVVECAMPIAQFATDQLQLAILPRVSSGELILSAVRPYEGLQDRTPLTAARDGDNWILNGCSSIVCYAPLAGGYLITARAGDDGNWVGYCPADQIGIELIAQRSTSSEAAAYLKCQQLVIDSAHTIATGEAADELLEWQAQRTYTAIAGQQACLLREGLQRAADYTNERKQFGRSLSSFQAVAQQAGDAYMAVEVLRGVYWRAVDDIDSGRDAGMSARVAKYWACESGHIAAHIILHIHGGMGQDLDYPIHRFFIWAKQNERYLGGASHHATALGKLVTENIGQVLALSA